VNVEYNRQMKRFIVVVLIILVTVFILLRVVRTKIGHDLAAPVYQPASTPTPTITIDKLARTSTYLFVPDWALSDIPDNYDTYIYFGISPTTNGIDEHDSGVKDISTFQDAMPSDKETLLALEMTDSDINGSILQSKSLQQKVISQTVSIAKANGFSGVVLDLEMSSIPFSSLVDEINDFTKSLDKEAKAQGLTFDVTLYGDTFYRLRPFDVKTIAANSDMVMVMAYDFHKSQSDPGPNFPLSGADTYGYDMGKMSDDFLQAVPNQKLGVIFGLFGYDWPVDSQGNAVGQGQPLTDLQIQNKFLNGCQFKDCQIKHDSVSAETEIHYTDSNNQKHIVWFEDMQSVTTKEQYLRKRGIGNFSFWANSYF
jgi:spore germination protein YaaH